MSSESGDQNQARAQTNMASHQAPPRTDPLPCPRCASSNTKFCYYNNYNLSQPRYFCKGCRRYWTQGGTLRNVPVGGGTRKSSSNSKRHRSSPSSSTTTSNNTNTNTNATSSSSSTVTHEPEPVPGNPVSVLPLKVDMNLNESLTLPVNLNESYPVSENLAMLLDIQGPPGSLNLGGYGLVDEMGLEFGPQRIWPFFGTTNNYLGVGVGVGVNVGGVNGNNNNNGGGGSNVGCNNNTWQMSDVENGEGDCYGWSGLAISTAGKGLK